MENLKTETVGDLFPASTFIPESALPNNTDAETSILGTVLVNNSVLEQLETRINASDFAEPFHAELWHRIRAIVASGRQASLVSLAPEIRGRKIGVMDAESYLGSLVQVAVQKAEELDGYVVEVLHFSKCREQLRIARDLAVNAMSRSLAMPSEVTTFIDRLEGNAMRGGPNKCFDDAVMQWPEMGAAAFRGIAGDIVRLATADSEADPVAVLATFLTFAGCAFGREAYVMVGDKAHHPVIFAVAVGESARARKGTSEAPIRALFGAIAKMLSAPLAITPGPFSSGEGIVFRLRDATKDADGTVSDAGVEDKRLVVMEGEFAGLLKIMQRDGNIASPLLRTFWDGTSVEPLTKNNRLIATNPHLCLVGHITRQELRPLLATPELFNGFANRMMWFAVRRTKLVANPAPMNQDAVSAIARRLASLIESNVGGGNVPFTTEAATMWETVYLACLSVEQPGLAGVITARSDAQARRVALIYALLDGKSVVDVTHLESALAVVEYVAASVRFIFGDTEPDPLIGRIIEKLSAGPLTSTELRAKLSNHVKAKALQQALEHLQATGRVRGEKFDTGGRPKQVWRLIGKA